MNIEVIAIAIGAVATVLGGVWFMLQKAFGYGRLVSRVDDVHQRTTNASCDAHDKAIGALKRDMQRIKQDMTSVKTFLSTKYKEDSFVFSRKHCSRRLNEVGLRLYKEIDGENFLQEHRDFFFSKIEQMHPKTPLEVDNNAYYVCGAYTNEDIFNGLKNFLYNAPAYRIKDENGVERDYDLSLSDCLLRVESSITRHVLGGSFGITEYLTKKGWQCANPFLCCRGKRIRLLSC